MGQPKLGVSLIGAQKAGSTSLAAWLAGHPQLCHSKVKETHFWSAHEDASMQRAPEEVQAWFDDQFASRQPGQLLVDSSTSYSMAPEFPGVAGRLAEHNPEMKVLYLLRDPVARIRSHLGHDYRNRKIDAMDVAALETRPRYLARSRYFRQLQEYDPLFPASQIHVVVFEELRESPADQLGAIEAFLGIEGGAAELPRLNTTEGRRGPTGVEASLAARNVRLPNRVQNQLRSRWGREATAVDLAPDTEAWLRSELTEDRALLEERLGRSMPWPT